MHYQVNCRQAEPVEPTHAKNPAMSSYREGIKRTSNSWQFLREFWGGGCTHTTSQRGNVNALGGNATIE